MAASADSPQSSPSWPPLELAPMAARASNTNETASNTNEKPTKKGKKRKRKGAHDDGKLVGVHEEGNYSGTESLAALSDSSYDTDLAASSDSDCSDPEYERDVEIFDEDDEDDSSVFSYDVDDPCFDIGVVFPDVKQCKSALTQHAILNGYAFRTVKKDKKRFQVKCLRAEEGCKWTFFASTSSKKYLGCKVKKNGPIHKCSSVNNCGDTMATINWVAERVVDWLKDKSTKGPKELQAALRKKYSMEIPYDKVSRGKEKALDMIFGKWDDSYDLLPTYRAELLKISARKHC
ncbi:uncharacterized protein LOC101768945 [Setaria italica]|uniref:uncharacterized protein LOC101768945 n=1 Tax=Setaria italica TaxID=4555 RepID=UPI000647148C|nr:uncharacterized protein LOC101768945 [Setaria italica]